MAGRLHSNEDFEKLFPESLSEAANTRSTYSFNNWLNSIYGYLSSGRAYVNWDSYYDADYYQVWEYNSGTWVYLFQLIGEAGGFVDYSGQSQYYIRCTDNYGTSVGKSIYL